MINFLNTFIKLSKKVYKELGGYEERFIQMALAVELREILSKNKNLKKLFAFEYGDTSGHFSFNGNEIVGKYLEKILLD